jgi:hypothetical protein
LIFSDVKAFEVLGRSGVYRHTFPLKFHRPHGLVGERWAINREVSGSILSPKSVGVGGGAPGTAGGWMTVLMKSQRTPRQDWVVLVGLRRRLLQSESERKNWYSPTRPAV